MFPGMFMKKPDKAAALKQLRTHVAMFGGWVVLIRVTLTFFTTYLIRNRNLSSISNLMLLSERGKRMNALIEQRAS